MTLVEKDLAELEQQAAAGLPADQWLAKAREYLRTASTPAERNARKAAVYHLLYSAPLRRKAQQ